MAQLSHLEFLRANNFLADWVFVQLVRCQAKIIVDVGRDTGSAPAAQICPTQVQVEESKHFTLVDAAFLPLNDLQKGVVLVLTEIDGRVISVRATHDFL